MIATMPHRGPDASGTTAFRGGGFGHVRLAILDLRPESHQPFMIDDGRYLLTYNGEVYNYLELRQELEELGHCFRTTSDTEVLLYAYKQWGRESVKRFNGMWAFAIYDRERDELFCSRDRFGVKPFYFTEHLGSFIFASEIKAILAVERSLAQPDHTSLSLFLRSQINAERVDTFFAKIKRLEPAHNLIITRQGWKTERYWSYPTDRLDDVSEKDAAEQLRYLLTDALRIRMRSDVPVGSTLSGGVDSSSLACLLRTFDDKPHNTFTASYPGAPFDEAPLAVRLATELGMTSNVIPATTTEFLDTLQKCVFHLDAPSHTPAVLPVWNIMREMRKKVVVAIEGQGADELIAGYVTACFPAAFLDELREGRISNALRDLRLFTGEWGWRLILAWMIRSAAPGTHRAYRKYRGDEGVYAGPLANGPDREMINGVVPHFNDNLTSLLHGQHIGGLRSLLHYGDAISMAHSVESRLPFMDYRLVETVFRLPGRLKLRGGHGKSLLKEAMRPVVPTWILDSRRKLGFQTPIERWFRETPEISVDPVLRDTRCRQRGLFNPKKLDEALDKHKSGKVDLSRQIFRWISMELWFREFIDN